ncbi:hypothetical protein [Haloferax sp. DFSO60]|uniref:DUF5789 family protein n=1 Tax=Haloferax sp. DFSO60 TaxID=3388652 RepID=UPI0039781E1B
MHIHRLEAYLSTEFSYPVTTQQVITQIGSIEVDAPDADDSETIETILEPLGGVVCDSPQDLFNTILGNLSDDFIGRKFYDDRGANPMPTPKSATDPENQSF